MKYSNSNIIILSLILFILNPFVLFAEKKEIPINYFRAPVDFTMTLAGNFGELRNNHFHSGIDIRTFTTGKKVYAAADGYVSRIKVSATGYGKALYIDHPNGYTTVYAHLSRFNPEIEAFIKTYQSHKKSFAVDLNLAKNQFVVEKGNIIAYSGNSGTSGGPHLHFEIRETKSEHPLNPLLFGFKIKDTTPPKIFNLYIYPKDSLSSVNGNNSRLKFPVTFYNNAFHLKGDPAIKLSGKIGFAIQCYDYLDNTWGKCGIYKLQLKINDSLITKYQFDEFSFDETRYINSLIDYGLNISENRRIYKTFREPNNKLDIYQTVKNNGIFQFKKEVKYKITLIASDNKNNQSKLSFHAEGFSIHKAFPKAEFTKIMNYENPNSFSNSQIKASFPINSFYSNINFDYSTRKDISFLSPIHSIHNELTAVHRYYTLSIKTPFSRKSLFNKLLIVRINKKDELVNEGGVYIDGWVKTKTRYFGDFAVTIDTIAPSIKLSNGLKKKNYSKNKHIDFIIKDELAGIKSYNGFIDGKWVLFEYDKKNNRLQYYFDIRRLKRGNHQIKLTIIDFVGNKSDFTSNFYW
ncbi:M23 family metallopeptidase [Ancylomarina longa]|uniref:M23 family metallopeptidase n=1 Tax=Ancylomarina longa TaxID=2487017 RepID=A0A434AZH9_9BACT|nr:M23 family metallopeptidase [Ancylomarina longa]RUT80028.1 M23 family metallopeptidase [Ancylomarina longa]